MYYKKNKNNNNNNKKKKKKKKCIYIYIYVYLSTARGTQICTRFRKRESPKNHSAQANDPDYHFRIIICSHPGPAPPNSIPQVTRCPSGIDPRSDYSLRSLGSAYVTWVIGCMLAACVKRGLSCCVGFKPPLATHPPFHS